MSGPTPEPPPAVAAVTPDDLPRVIARLEQLRKQGIYAIAAVLAFFVFGIGYLVLRDSSPKAPPLADPFQVVQNEQKDLIKLDRRNGEYWVLEDGIVVRHATPLGSSYSLLDDKVYTWDKTPDGSKMTVRVKYANKTAYCSWRIWPSEELKKSLSTPNDQRQFIRIGCYSRDGVRLLSIEVLWSFARWIQEGDSQILEYQAPEKCSAAVFNEIGTCRVSY
jgi:hypothetical protein